MLPVSRLYRKGEYKKTKGEKGRISKAPFRKKRADFKKKRAGEGRKKITPFRKKRALQKKEKKRAQKKSLVFIWFQSKRHKIWRAEEKKAPFNKKKKKEGFTQKKNEGQKKGAKKSALFIFKGAKKRKKNEGQRPFFGGRLFGALLSI